jgi:hypothetical protein
MNNVTNRISNLAIIDKVDAPYHYFDFVFDKVGGKMKNFAHPVKNARRHSTLGFRQIY